MDPNEVRSDPESQRERGLTPDEQRAEREQESRETDETKFELLREAEEEQRDQAAKTVGDDPALKPRES